jgi:hypothetical protein
MLFFASALSDRAEGFIPKAAILPQILLFSALQFEQQEAQAQTYQNQGGREDSSVEDFTRHIVVFSLAMFL